MTMLYSLEIWNENRSKHYGEKQQQPASTSLLLLKFEELTINKRLTSSSLLPCDDIFFLFFSIINTSYSLVLNYIDFYFFIITIRVIFEYLLISLNCY
jgi:hypothetical protein